MRLSDVMKMEVTDRSGDRIGTVKEVMLERRGSAWEMTAFIVGAAGISERLGFTYGEVERPVILAALMRWVGRHARVVRWHDLSLGQKTAVVNRRKADLPHPRDQR